MVYSPSPERMASFIEELDQGRVVQLGRGVEEVVAALVDDPPPRPQVLVLDIDLLTPGELFHLHSLRERGWCGAIIAVGRVPKELARSLNIETVLPSIATDHGLSDAVAAIRFDAQTIQIPVLGR